MVKEDLNFVAEALLALCEKDAGAPFYLEDALDQKIRKATRRDLKFPHLPPEMLEDALLRSECESVFQQSGLTDRQKEVLDRRLDGWTFEEIGRERGTTKQGAQRVFVQALKKLGRTFRVYAYVGLSDVYREELRRGRPKLGVGRIVR